MSYFSNEIILLLIIICLEKIINKLPESLSSSIDIHRQLITNSVIYIVITTNILFTYLLSFQEVPDY